MSEEEVTLCLVELCEAEFDYLFPNRFFFRLSQPKQFVQVSGLGMIPDSSVETPYCRASM